MALDTFEDQVFTFVQGEDGEDKIRQHAGPPMR